MNRKIMEEILEINRNIGRIEQVEKNTQNSYIVHYTKDGVVGINSTIITEIELAHKCKEWAMKQSFCLMSGIHPESCICEVLSPNLSASTLFTRLHKTFDADTEPEAIFKACEWILEQKEIGL